MSIDVRVPGNPGSIRTVAEWLGSIRASLQDADAELAYIWTDSNSYWTGESGSGWRAATSNLRDRAQPIPALISDAMEVFHAYANRLERLQADFATLLFQAGEVGLIVCGTVVLPPATDLAYCPGPSDPIDDQRRYATFVGLLESYDDLARQVGTALGELDVWVGEHIVGVLARIGELQRLAGIVSDMTKNGNELIASSVLEGYETFVDKRLGEWRKAHDGLQDTAEAFIDRLRSGNPAVRAAAEAADPKAMRAGVEALAEQIGRVSQFAKVIPIAGGAVEVVSLAVDVAEGGSVSSGVAGIVGGAAGGTAGAAAGTSIGAALSVVGVAGGPVAWAVGVGVGAAVVGGWAGRWAWEASVPLDVRESIDDFFVGQPPRLSGYVPPPPHTR
ncbi:hypothetical protein [Microbacterium testaceum]|uniref:hypothetical protein n=1 Tax=Microbacterium testaceum TaxID=2033 RepID=UPI00381B8460